jgi:hypothetical protein
MHNRRSILRLLYALCMPKLTRQGIHQSELGLLWRMTYKIEMSPSLNNVPLHVCRQESGRRGADAIAAASVVHLSSVLMPGASWLVV